MLDWLIRVAAPWNTLYSDNTLVSTAVVFIHLGAILVAGGTALAADRRILRSRQQPTLRIGYLDDARATHRLVVGALAVAAAAGVMMFLGDVETLATSPVFWIKLALVGMLLTNGLMITKVEKRMRSKGEKLSDEVYWQPLRHTARISQTLWFATLLAGVALRTI